MPKYAWCPKRPGQVLGWYDTDMLHYPNLPPSSELIELNEQQWNARMENPSAFFVEDDRVVKRDNQEEQKRQLDNHRVMLRGLDVNGHGDFSPSLIQELAPIISDLRAGMPFPLNRDTYAVKDIDGNWHEFTSEQITKLYEALRDHKVLVDRHDNTRPFSRMRIDLP